MLFGSECQIVRITVMMVWYEQKGNLAINRYKDQILANSTKSLEDIFEYNRTSRIVKQCQPVSIEVKGLKSDYMWELIIIWFGDIEMDNWLFTSFEATTMS